MAPASAHMAPPVEALPLIFQRLVGDLPSLSTVCCVSCDWRDAAEATPEAWQFLKFPKGMAERVTNSQLESLLARSGQLGIRSLDLEGVF